MILVLWFSMWVIWLITTSFQSQTPLGKFRSLLIWRAILRSNAKASGLRWSVRETEMMENSCSLLNYRETDSILVRNQILASEGCLSNGYFWNVCRRMSCYYTAAYNKHMWLFRVEKPIHTFIRVMDPSASTPHLPFYIGTIGLR